jgi:hypothetical protein
VGVVEEVGEPIQTLKAMKVEAEEEVVVEEVESPYNYSTWVEVVEVVEEELCQVEEVVVVVKIVGLLKLQEEELVSQNLRLGTEVDLEHLEFHKLVEAEEVLFFMFQEVQVLKELIVCLVES